jgi:hypothetical protein
VLLGLTLLHSPPSTAEVVYSYRSQPFNVVVDYDPPTGTYTTSMRLAIDLVFANPLPPSKILNFADSAAVLDFTFNDGRFSINKNNDDNFWFDNTFRLVTDSSGAIVNWDLAARREFVPFASASVGDNIDVFMTSSRLIISDNTILSACSELGVPSGSCRDRQIDEGYVERLSPADVGRWTGPTAVVTAVIEPGSLLLLISGLSAFALTRRRQTRLCARLFRAYGGIS